jgi:AbrB family looped-hinge helix DNA binding protein
LISKITTKGQITIPIDIRTKFNIKPGDELDFYILDNKIICKPVKTIKIDPDDEWIFQEENKNRIKEGLQDIKNNKSKKFNKSKVLLKWLKS